MQAHRVEAIVKDDLSLTLRDLPFASGDAVEIIVLPLTGTKKAVDPNAWRKLQGLPLEYADPFGPATTPEDLDAQR